jgi:hypothetical protein
MEVKDDFSELLELFNARDVKFLMAVNRRKDQADVEALGEGQP